MAAGRLLASPITGKLLGMIRYEIVATTLLIASAVYAQEAAESAASKPSGLPKLAAPFVVEADGKPIDLKTGHAAPSVADLDGDGSQEVIYGSGGWVLHAWDAGGAAPAGGPRGPEPRGPASARPHGLMRPAWEPKIS